MEDLKGRLDQFLDACQMIIKDCKVGGLCELVAILFYFLLYYRHLHLVGQDFFFSYEKLSFLQTLFIKKTRHVA